MIVNRERLERCLNILMTVVGNKVMPISDFLKFEIDTESGKLYISATNFLAFMIIEVGDVEEYDNVESTFLIHAKKLFGLVSQSTTDVVEFKQKKNDNLSMSVISNGKYVFRLRNDVENFPVVDFEYDHIAEYSLGEILMNWSGGSLAVSKDVTQVAVQSVFFDGNWVSTDFTRLSMVQDEKVEGGESLLIPTIFGNILKQLEGMNIIFGKSKDGKNAIVRDDSLGLFASVRLIDNEFINYHNFLNKVQPFFSLGVNLNSLTRVLNRLYIFCDSVYKILQVKVDFTGSDPILTFQIQHDDSGEEQVFVMDHLFNIRPDKKVFEFSFDIEKFLQGVEHLSSDDELCAINFTSNGIFYLKEDNFSYYLQRMDY